MRFRRLRPALAAALAAPLLVGPVVALAVSAPVGCPGAGRDGPWQILPVEAFAGTEGVSTRDVVTGYAVDPSTPERVLATNGNTVKISRSYGCEWQDSLVLDASPDEAVPVSGAASTVVSTALLPGGPALAAIREGSGAASRPHVAVSRSGEKGSWRLSDAGLPAQGAPRLLEGAEDGRTAYLVLSPVSDGGTAGGTLPGLPNPPVVDPAGSLYATTNGGGSWQLRTPAGELPAEGVTGMSVDPADPSLLYLVSGGRLLISRDGGLSLRDAGLSGIRAVEAMEPREVAVAQDPNPEDGLVLHSKDGGATFEPRTSSPGVDSLAYRRGDGVLLAEGNGLLLRVNARKEARPERVRVPLPPKAGSALGDRGPNGSFTVLGGHAILRWVDPSLGDALPPPPVLGDRAPPPPPDGRVAPPAQSVSMPVGETRLLDYTLVLPPSPTPVDLMFLVDTSPNMKNYIEDLRTNLRQVADSLAAAGVDVQVGLATAGPGPADGEPPYPEVDPTDPEYRKPSLYRLLRQIGPVDRQLLQALDGLQVDSAPQNAGQKDVLEGQLFSLAEMVLGTGLKESTSTEAAPRFAVPPGQKAGFRPQLGIRRLIIHATDEPFNNPRGTPRKADKSPDLEGVAALLRANRIQQAGIAPNETASLPDLRRMAELTGARVPEGGLDCTNDVILAPGDPLVCPASAGFAGVITDLVRDLVDEQDVSFAPTERTPVVGSVDEGSLKGVNVTLRNELPVQVRVSCVDVRPGTYDQTYTATLRGFKVAEALARVTCTAPAVAAAVPPRPQPPAVQEPAAPPAGQPAAQAPAPPAPAPPVVQPQAQPQAQAQTQVQAQVNPMTAAMLQQQQELQLALALSADERPEGSTQYAMVDRGRSQQLRALALLSVSMAAASAVGLGRLRTRRAEGVRVGRAR